MVEAAIDVPEGEAAPCTVRGALTFETVTSVWVPGLEAIMRRPRVEFDLGAISRIDSAGLALLVEWLRAAHQHHTSIRFSHLPEQVSRLARACHVDGLLRAEERPGAGE